MDGVEPVGIHIVGQTRGAADAGDYGGHFGSYAQVGHGLVERIEDGVVAATGTPAHGAAVLEVGGLILRCCTFHVESVALKCK